MQASDATPHAAGCAGGCCSNGEAYEASAATITRQTVVLRLTVRNHPGVMSHVCGMFARRAFNVEGILVLPKRDGATSTMLLLVNEDERLEQMERQLAKLEDVLEIHRESDGHRVFAAVGEFIG